METTHELRFESPSFARRIKGMLGVDFYRLFHTPMFYIFLAIAAMIPALLVSGMGADANETATVYTNVWQVIAANKPLYVVSNMGEYANMNMVFIFGGIMVSIFIGHDYKSGYVKRLFTTHAKKQDYMISKALTGAFSMACMCITYLIGGVAAGTMVGLSYEVDTASLVFALLSKIIMSLGWASLYTFLNTIFRKYFGISVASSFFLGTGIPIIGAAAIVGNSTLLNVFLYGSSVYACLSSSIVTLLVCAAVSIGWSIIYTLLGSLVLSRCDVY